MIATRRDNFDLGSMGGVLYHCTSLVVQHIGHVESTCLYHCITSSYDKMIQVMITYHNCQNVVEAAGFYSLAVIGFVSPFPV